MLKTKAITGFLLTGMLMLCFGGLKAQKSEPVPAEYIRHFFGAAHLKTQYHPYASSTGVIWSRMGTRWHQQEPRRDEYRFGPYDALVESAREHGIKILPLIGHSAPWAADAPEGSDEANRYAPSKDMIGEWKEYVEKVVERYPHIEYFEVWNEPNIDWFLRADTNYRVYVDRILIPAAKVIHGHGRKVVGPSFTTEWPMDSWPPKKRPRRHAENVASNIHDINRWLSYRDAWKHIDILAIHYPHGDTRKPSRPYADNMMRFYDYVYTKWIEPGKLEGIWNTEAGFAGVEAGMQGFVALDPWEHEPLEQWVARYVIPPLHWSIRHNWHFRDQYKLFWYHMSVGDHPRDMLTREDGKIIPSSRSKALRTIGRLLTGQNKTGIYPNPVRTGYGIFSRDTSAINYFAPYEMKNYAFTVDNRIVIAIWAQLTGKTAFNQPLQVIVGGLDHQNYQVTQTHYISGKQTDLDDYILNNQGRMRLKIPPLEDPIIYITLKPES